MSEASAETIEKAIVVETVTAGESEYSLWNRETEETLLPTLEKLDIGFISFSPLGKGFLMGKINVTTQFTAGDGRNSLLHFTVEAVNANQALIDVIH